MNIKHENGMVTFTKRAGKDLVRSQMTIGSALSIVKCGGEVVEEGDRIIVDDTYFFPAVVVPKKRKKEVEDDAE